MVVWTGLMNDGFHSYWLITLCSCRCSGISKLSLSTPKTNHGGHGILVRRKIILPVTISKNLLRLLTHLAILLNLLPMSFLFLNHLHWVNLAKRTTHVLKPDDTHCFGLEQHYHGQGSNVDAHENIVGVMTQVVKHNGPGLINP